MKRLLKLKRTNINDKTPHFLKFRLWRDGVWKATRQYYNRFDIQLDQRLHELKADDTGSLNKAIDVAVFRDEVHCNIYLDVKQDVADFLCKLLNSNMLKLSQLTDHTGLGKVFSCSNEHLTLEVTTDYTDSCILSVSLLDKSDDDLKEPTVTDITVIDRDVFVELCGETDLNIDEEYLDEIERWAEYDDVAPFTLVRFSDGRCEPRINSVLSRYLDLDPEVYDNYEDFCKKVNDRTQERIVKMSVSCR